MSKIRNTLDAIFSNATGADAYWRCQGCDEFSAGCETRTVMNLSGKIWDTQSIVNGEKSGKLYPIYAQWGKLIWNLATESTDADEWADDILDTLVSKLHYPEVKEQLLDAGLSFIRQTPIFPINTKGLLDEEDCISRAAVDITFLASRVSILCEVPYIEKITIQSKFNDVDDTELPASIQINKEIIL